MLISSRIPVYDKESTHYFHISYYQMMQHPLNVLNLNNSKNNFLKSVLRNWYGINNDCAQC